MCVKGEAAPVTMGEGQSVQYVCFHMCVCVCVTAEGSPWLQLKGSCSGGDPPFQAFRFLASHHPDLHPGLTSCVAQGWAAVPGQSSPIVPLCYSVTVLPPRGPGQGKHCIGCIDGVCFEPVCTRVFMCMRVRVC